uniref:FRIGIDA-like protein n=1 Tax=Oryza brachyantha TaxID=4533 RepID=J3KUX0_ORYBR
MESYLDSVQGYISRGLDSLQEAVLRAGPSLSSHVGLAVEVAGEGREEGASVFAKQDGGDGAAAREEAPPGGDTVIASVEEEEIKAAAEEEVVVNQNGMEVAAKKVRNHANASTRVGMKSNGKGESPDLDSGEVMAIEDGKEKVVSAIEPSKPEPEQGAGMSVMETMVETEDATKKVSQERIRHAFDTIDKVALESPTQKLTLEKKVGIPLMDWTKKKEGEIFEMPLDQFNEETAMEAGSIQEDDAQGEDMDICSEEGEVHIETKKKKVAIDMQDDGMLVGGIKAEAREKKTRTRTSLEEDAKVATDNVGANAGAGRQERRHRQREPVPRRQLVAACERMGSFDLVELVLRANRSIASEFLPAMRCAPDAPALALHVTGHLLSTDPRDVHSASWENLAVLLRSVRSLATTSRATAPPPIDASAKEATTMAKMWSAIIAGEVEYHPVAWGHSATWALLQFVAAYGIAGNLEVKDMMLFHTVGDRDGGAELIRSLGLADKATELINHLLKKGKHINAIKVVRAFNLIDKFLRFLLSKHMFRMLRRLLKTWLARMEFHSRH